MFLIAVTEIVSRNQRLLACSMHC